MIALSVQGADGSILAISGGSLEGFKPKVGSLQILETTKSSLTIEAKVNVTNPTDYSATVPYVNICLLSNGSRLGYATAENISVVPGQNDNMLVKALWEPHGKHGRTVARELLSQYISGNNAAPESAKVLAY